MLNSLSMHKKNKTLSQPNQSYLQAQKQNLTSGLFDHNKSAIQHGSNFVSPTFQNNNISLKDAIYRQSNKQNYVSVNLNLKQAVKQQVDWEKQYKLMENKLYQHYQSKKYWKKLQKLLSQQGVDALFAWSQAIEKYSGVKQQGQKHRDQNRILKEYNEKLKAQIGQLQNQLQKTVKQFSQGKQKMTALEAQIQQDKNQTRLLSQKKCKGCQFLAEKEKQYSELFSVNKKQKIELDKFRSQSQESKNNLTDMKGQLAKMQQKYQNLMYLKEEVDKKNQKMTEKEKQWQMQKEKMGAQQQQATRLHIELEHTKQKIYQIEKNSSKIQQKYKREINQLRQELEALENEKNVISESYQKIKIEMNQLKPKLLKMGHQLQDTEIQMSLKEADLVEIRKRHNQAIQNELNKRREAEATVRNLQQNSKELVDKIAEKDQQIAKVYALLEESERSKIQKEHIMTDERKKFAQIKKQIQEKDILIEKLQRKIKEIQEQMLVNSGKKIKTKNHHSNTEQSLSRRVASTISQMHQMLLIFKEQDESLPRMRRVLDYSQQRQGSYCLNQRKLGQMVSELKLVLNRYTYLLNENDTLKQSIENYLGLEQENVLLRRNVQLKQQALSCLVGLTPQDLKDSVCNLLMIVQNLSSQQEQSSQQMQMRIEQLKEEGRRWMENHIWMQNRLRKLQQENEELRRKQGIKTNAKKVVTDYDSKQIRNRNDIRRKYNFD